MNTAEWKQGHDAFFRENATGDIICNPYEFGPKHDEWDAGYQAALDFYTRPALRS